MINGVHEEEGGRPARESTARVVAAGTGASAGLLLGGPAGAMLAAAGTQLAVEATGLALSRLGERRTQRAAVPIAVAASITDTSPAAISERFATVKELEPLLVTVLTAAAQTALDEKLRALGQVLANVVADSNSVDEEWVVAEALKSVEAPHLKALEYLDRYWPDGTAPDLYGSARVLGQLGTALTPVLRTLEMHGLIWARTESREDHVGPVTYGDLGTRRTVASYRQRHSITEFGHAVLERLRTAPGVS